jgi:arsenite-transporting ATPase
MLAVDAAATGPTLLVTTDPASSLPDVLAVKVGPDPAPVRGARGLFAANVDATRAFQQWLAPRKDLLATIAVRGTYLDDEDVARLLKLSLPGIDEVIGLVEIVRMVQARRPSSAPPSPRLRRAGKATEGRDAAAGFDTVVVDTAPTGHTLRLLASPVLLGRVAGLLDSLQSHHRTVVSALRGSYRTDAADTLIAELEREGEALAATLRDPVSSQVWWVTLAEPMALEETSDALAALDAARIRVPRLIVNRVTPPSAPAGRKPRRGERENACEWCDARRRFEARALAPVARRFADRELVVLPELPVEPRGVAALREAAALLAPWTPPSVPPPLERRVRAGALPVDVPPEGGRHKPGGRKESVPVASAFSRKDAIDAVTGSARWLLFGGKGGVGKSTCAAAAALHLAATRRVLLLSTDPAHSLGDVLGASFDNQPRAVPGAPAGLFVREIDAAAEMDRFRRKYVDAVDEAFARIARTAGGDQAAFRDLIDLAPPGIDEVIAIADVAEAITEGKGGYDVIVTDTAPTGHALRLLQTPAVLREWTQALMVILLKYREIVGAGTLAALLVQLSKRLRGLQDILRDPAQARFVVVTRAAALPIAETTDLIASLQGLGIAVAAVVVNAVGAGECGRCRRAAAAQAEHLGRLRATLAGYAAIIEAPAEMPPPHGAAALTDWGTAWRRIV